MASEWHSNESDGVTMTAVFPEIKLTVVMRDGTETDVTLMASAIVAMEQKYNISLPDIGGRTEYFMYMAHAQLRHDGEKVPVFKNWLRKVRNVDIDESGLPSLDDDL